MSVEQGFLISDMLLPLAGAVVIVMALLLRGLCRVLKVAPESLVGVQAKPTPFASRKEYLAAAAEMDLEQFVECAYVTPADVKYAQCSESKIAREKLRKLADRLEHSSRMKKLKRIYQESHPAEGPGQDMPKEGMDVDGGLPRKPRCWYRGEDNGKLIMFVRSSNDNTGIFLERSVVGEDFQVLYLWSEVELALPREGETWIWNSCAKHGFTNGGTTFVVIAGPFVGDGLAGQWVLCGCLAPVEFGKGKV